MFIVNNRKFFFILSGALVLGSILAMFLIGLNLGIDFKGGSLLTVSYPATRPAPEVVKPELDKLNLGNYILTPQGDLQYNLKAKDLNPAEKTAVESALSPNGNSAKEENFNSIGPTIGSQMRQKALAAIILVIICIVLFVTFAFRKVSVPVASWKYGVATIVALAHDVIIPTGVYIIWTHYNGGEVDMLFVSAILAILGYSVHDTIVVFDRVRENLKTAPNKEPFVETVGKSVTQTFGRSINTSLTIFLALVALYFLGGTSTKDFALVLLVGIIVGTYSSIFVASPLLVTLEKLQKK